MKSMRNLVAYFLALAMAAFAVPGLAGNKTFDLTASSRVTANQSIDVVFTNRDDGNSSFNSVRIAADKNSLSGTLQIVDARQTGSNKKGFVAVSQDGLSVTITDLSPIKAGQQNKLTVTLLVRTSAPKCADGSITWIGSAWTGSPSTPSNPFTTADSPTTKIASGSCEIAFETEPNLALKDQLITSEELKPTGAKVKVSVKVNGAAPQSDIDVTLASTCTGSSLSPSSFTTKMAAGTGSVEFDNLKSSDTATGCTLKATTSALDPVTYYDTSSSFSVVEPKLVITTSLPNGFALGSPTAITAELKYNNNTVPQSGTGTLTVSASCEPASVEATAINNGTLIFEGVKGKTSGGSCTLTATATFNGATYTSSQFGPFAVYEKSELDCASTPPNPGGTGYFEQLPSGVSSVTQVGYAAGYRAQNDKNSTCLKVNYTFTNNIGTVAAPGASGVTDGLGNTLPANSASFVWPEGYQPDAVFTYTLTFQPEYVSTTSGLPVKKTKFCKVQKDGAGNLLPTDCTNTSNQEDLKACLSPTLSAASIPGTDPACIAGEMWTTVAGTQCSSLTNPNGSGLPPACVVVTTRIIDARDPPIIR